MTTSRIASRVLHRWLQKLADQVPGQRKRVQDMTNPINPPKGVSMDVRREVGQVRTEGDDVTKSDRKDIQPKDVFYPTRGNVGVQNLVETGKGFSEKQVENNKGFDTVKNLSQYLIRTEGGGEGGPEGKKL